ncbi:hypothetical protein E2542_SST07941 [Spatholobus suberectus]|nr:hypothetical protein E2542_SST07941 [Spatholobus suberectus]
MSHADLVLAKLMYSTILALNSFDKLKWPATFCLGILHEEDDFVLSQLQLTLPTDVPENEKNLRLVSCLLSVSLQAIDLRSSEILEHPYN